MPTLERVTISIFAGISGIAATATLILVIYKDLIR